MKKLVAVILMTIAFAGCSEVAEQPMSPQAEPSTPEQILESHLESAMSESSGESAKNIFDLPDDAFVDFMSARAIDALNEGRLTLSHFVEGCDKRQGFVVQWTDPKPNRPAGEYTRRFQDRPIGNDCQRIPESAELIAKRTQAIQDALNNPHSCWDINHIEGTYYDMYSFKYNDGGPRQVVLYDLLTVWE